MDIQKVSSILFVGTGGGNDVFSTHLAADAMWRYGWRWDVCDFAGVISPFHRHEVVDTAVPGVFETLPTSKRFLLRRGDEKEIGFIDAAVASMPAHRDGYVSEHVLALSLERGTVGLTEAFKELTLMYDRIILVDLGGDIFYSGPSDTHVLSPMFDAMVLRAFVDSGAKGFLFEAGPGTDGELDSEALAVALGKSGAKMSVMPGESLDAWEELYKTWIEPVRPGRTVPITLQAARSHEHFLTVPYRARAHLGHVRKYAWFDQRISVGLCTNLFVVDPSRIVNPFAVACTDPYDWFVKTQALQQHTNNEANLEYQLLPDGRIRQFLTPSPLFNASDRHELIDLGFQEFLAGVTDELVVLRKDWPLIEHRVDARFVDQTGPCIIIRK